MNTEDKDCSKCVYVRTGERTMNCDYPVPAWITIRSNGGGNFLTGYEASSCPLFLTKEMLAERERKL